MIRRRKLLQVAAAAPWLAACHTTANQPPPVGNDPPADLRPILAPPLIVKAPEAPQRVIDAHAHFFNARDVPVAGYLAGPVAHSTGGWQGDLIRSLAPLAEQLAQLAPGAKTEFDELVTRASGPKALDAAPGALRDVLLREREDYLRRTSRDAFELLRGSEFEALFNRRQEQLSPLWKDRLGPEALPLSGDSIFNALQRDQQKRTLGARSLAEKATTADPVPAHADGVLAFLGLMLSYRWMNLLAYQQAFSTQPGAFGVDVVLGALVDFDHWLEPARREPHDDQIRLHQLLSQLSAGYMRPLVAYNPHGATSSRLAALWAGRFKRLSSAAMSA